jgi:hypothetical protein
MDNAHDPSVTNRDRLYAKVESHMQNDNYLEVSCFFLVSYSLRWLLKCLFFAEEIRHGRLCSSAVFE